MLLLRVASALIPISLLIFFLRRTSRKSPHYLQGKVVVVTGASSGLGAACAKLFHSIGCKVVLCGRNQETLQQVADSLIASDVADEYCPLHRYAPKIVLMDLADLASIPVAADAAAAAFGGAVDVLVNNAGVSYRGEIATTELSVDERLLTVNYLGQVALTKALLPRLLEDKEDGDRSHIVAVSSVQGKMSIPFRSAYSASKHALQSFFDCLRAETAGTRLSVHVISPGYIATNLSVNAVTGAGGTYGVVDETTAKGLAPEVVAERLVEMIFKEEAEVVLADTHVKLAIALRALCPALFFWFMNRRALKHRQSIAAKKLD